MYTYTCRYISCSTHLWLQYCIAGNIGGHIGGFAKKAFGGF